MHLLWSHLLQIVLHLLKNVLTSESDSASVWDFKTGLELEWKSKSWSKSRFSKLRTKSLLKEYLSKKSDKETSALIKRSN